MFINRLSGKTDEALVQMIQRGEARALSELYGRYQKKIFRYFYRMLWKDKQKAEDFLHDLFVKLIESPHHVDAGKRFSTWLYSVAHNMCKNEYRRQQFRDGVRETLMRAEAMDNTIVEDIDQRDFMQALDNAMATWPEDDRSLFVWRHELGMTFAEIAAILDCPEGTAKSKWFYMKKKLAQHVLAYQPVLKVKTI